MQKSGRFLFHLFAAGLLAFGIYYDVTHVHFPPEFKRSVTPYGGRWKYLTFWNLNIQCGYFFFCLLNDLFGSSSLSVKDRSLLQTIRDYLFGAIVHPVSLLVGAAFWGLYAIDRELIFPKALDAFFPSWLNHVMHTCVVIFALAEMALVPKIFPARSKALTGLLILLLTYLIWVFIIAYKTDFWVYPVLAVLHWGQRSVFIAGIALVAFVLYLIGEKLHHSIWGKPSTAKSSNKTKPTNQGKEAIKPTSSTNNKKARKGGKQN